MKSQIHLVTEANRVSGEYPAGSVACAESTGELKAGHRNRCVNVSNPIDRIRMLTEQSKIFHTFHQCPNRYRICHGKLGSYDPGTDIYRKSPSSNLEASFRVGGFTTSKSFLPEIEAQRARRI